MNSEHAGPSGPLLQPLRHGRRACFAFSLGLFCPGWGHLYVGATRRGVLGAIGMLALGVPGLVWLWISCVRGPVTLLATLVLTILVGLLLPLDAVRLSRRLPARRPGWLRALLLHGLFVPLVFGLLQVELVALRGFLVQPFHTPTESMVPALLPGDFFLVDTRPQTRFQLQLGDVVVFEPPDGSGVHYAKRVVGLAGNEIEIRDGLLYVDGAQRTRANGTRTGCLGTEELGRTRYRVEVSPRDAIAEVGPLRVPRDSVFVLGDARGHSRDSRVFGAVPLERVRGRILHIFWSLDRARGEVRWGRLGRRFASIWD